ncbi:MAG: HNH endonuclease [Hamadaea sp.]|uniref:HNH endonuclease n=1 Tax=Hamadaea sp. TaxID=2024425 RepID=UPI0018360C7A|nr:HNH endonuclease [Hamadaea sp.]NUT19145.1 HNH endonuclease [Hamadaea sp.]
MIPLRRPELPTDALARMLDLTERIAAVPGPRRSAEARRIWSRDRTVRPTIRQALGGMAPGLERCMYCGDNQGSDVDHFEPLSRNPLRTFDWLNHLLACSICNGHYKRDRYPLDAEGNPLLVDPTVDDPADHLRLSLTTGSYVGLTARGEATIEVCGLNRAILTRGRLAARTTIERCLRMWDRARRLDETELAAEVLDTAREQPFTAVAYAMVRTAELPTATAVLPAEIVRLLRLAPVRKALTA